VIPPPETNPAPGKPFRWTARIDFSVGGEKDNYVFFSPNLWGIVVTLFKFARSLPREAKFISGHLWFDESEYD
jgi:hypothetical protein